jgi:hypothetical protein
MDAPIKTIAWDETYSIIASEKGLRHSGEHPLQNGFSSITDLSLT